MIVVIVVQVQNPCGLQRHFPLTTFFESGVSGDHAEECSGKARSPLAPDSGGSKRPIHHFQMTQAIVLHTVFRMRHRKHHNHRFFHPIGTENFRTNERNPVLARLPAVFDGGSDGVVCAGPERIAVADLAVAGSGWPALLRDSMQVSVLWVLSGHGNRRYVGVRLGASGT
ncbi:hypothetical protein ACW73L_21490 [Methylolobus aquaticus]